MKLCFCKLKNSEDYEEIWNSKHCLSAKIGDSYDLYNVNRNARFLLLINLIGRVENDWCRNVIKGSKTKIINGAYQSFQKQLGNGFKNYIL